MKRNLIVIIFSLQFISVFCFYTENGGYARILTIGNLKIAEEDITTNFDLFSKGFVASACFTTIQNRLTFNFSFSPKSEKENNKKISETEFFLNDTPSEYQIIFNLPDKSVGVLNLKGKYIIYQEEELYEDMLRYNLIKSSTEKIIAGFGYAKKISNNISFGFLLNDRYVFLKKQCALEKGVEENEEKVNKTDATHYSKLNYAIFLAYYINKNLQIALNIGNKNFNVKYIGDEITGLKLYSLYEDLLDYQNIILSGYDIQHITETFKSEITYEEKIFLKEKWENYCYNFDSGVQINQDDIKATIIAGILSGYTNKYQKSIWTEKNYYYFPVQKSKIIISEYENIKNLLGHKIDIAGRYKINENINFSCVFNYFFVGFSFKKEELLYNVKLMQLNFINAIALKFNKILIPLEFIIGGFYTDENNDRINLNINKNLILYGLKTGLEYEIENQIYLRLGYQLLKGGAEYRENSRQNIIDEKPGTDYNPFLIKSSFSFGIGHKFEDIEINLCFLNEDIFKMPTINNYKNRVNRVIVDLNKFF